MQSSYDIVIVGGGIYGTSLAYALSKEDCSIGLFESDNFAAGASGGPGERGVRASGRDLRELPIAARARELWKAYEETFTAGVGYRRTGGLAVFDTPPAGSLDELKGLARQRATAQTRLGVNTTYLEGDRLFELEPELSPSVVGALYCPEDGTANHTYATQQFGSRASEAGVDVVTGTSVATVNYSEGRAKSIDLDSGESVGVNQSLVLLCNTSVPELLPPGQGQDLPLWSIYPQMVYVRDNRDKVINQLISHLGRKLSMKQLPDGTFMLSGGLGIDNDSLGAHGSLKAMTYNVQDAVATFPFLSDAVFDKVNHERRDTVCVDGIPIIDQPTGIVNTYFGVGWSGHGFAISLGFTELIASWLKTGDKPNMLSPFSIARFSSQ
ncbi:NAD(P)/FAD-dependent oxidoreductase [Spelaeicoccus albus]|nr:FAD-binding oxidoreductase [Spelaeicoccus albus]